MSHTRFAFFSILLSLALTSIAGAANQPYKDFVRRISGQYFTFRANEALCHSSLSTWDGRTILECQVSRVGQSIAINGVGDWEGRYFVSGRAYKLRSAKLERRKDMLQLKLWARPLSRSLPQDEMQLEVPDALQMNESGFEQVFYGVFLRPTENLQKYEAKVDEELIREYIDPEPELFLLPLQERDKILQAIRVMGFPAQPKLERIGHDLYIPANLIADTSVYNDLQVSKNQRLATTIEKQMKDIRLLADQADKLPVIKGIRFEWKVYHKNLLDERDPPTVEDVEFLVPLQAISRFAAGNLSTFELVQQSLLRADGIKVTMTSFDPIGSQ